MNVVISKLASKTATVCTFALLTCIGGFSDLNAAPLNLSKVPLFTNGSVEPNFVLTFDDSGSMARGYVPDAFSEESVYFPDYPHTDGADADLLPDRIDTRCWWATANWSFSPEVNKLFFNPAITYAPPKNADGTTMPDRSFTAAPVDGIGFFRGTNTTTRNLANDFRILWEIGGGTNRPSVVRRATLANPAPDTTNGANCVTADTMYRAFPFADSRAFYYRYDPTLATCTAVAAASKRFNNLCYVAVDMTTRSSAEQTNFANWFSYYRSRNLLARSSLSRVFDTQQKLRVTWQAINNNLLTNDKVIASIASASTQRTDLFTFLQTNGNSGGTPNRSAMARVGNYYGGGNNQNSDLNTTNPYYDAATNAELSCRQNFHLMVTDGGWNGAAGVTGNFDTATLTLPDGKVYTPNTADTNIYSKEHPNNDDGLADNAFFFWSRDLRTNLNNNVPAAYEDFSVGVTGPNTPLGADELPSSRSEIYFNPKNDPATWQHMSQYIVGFGIGGDVPFPGSYNALRAGTYPGGWPNWGDDNATAAQVVDDTWHAAINGRGDFFNVNDPQELIDALSAVFLSINRRTASNTPVSLSSGLLTASTLSYQTLFDTSDWSGRVLASRLSTSTPEWDVSCLLTGGSCLSVPAAGVLTARDPNSRLIATSNGTAGVPFRFASLTGAQQALLNKNPDTSATDALGDQRVNYVRGDRTNEAANGGAFRTRKNLLGAVVNSLVVPSPEPEGYQDTTSFEPASSERASPYSVFRDSLPDQQTIYFGANDGMLHAVNSSSAATGGGQERWAYVPSTVIANLNKLTSASALQFQSYVDANPTIRDVFIGGTWRRVLVGGLRLGGQGIYALDVTNPIATSEGDVAAKVLWEFSDKSPGGANLGFTYGIPSMHRLENGLWTVLVPGGYNSDVADGAAGDGFGSLFVLRLDNGAVIREFNLGATSQGLASINAGDYRVDGGAHSLDVAEVAFAGDLSGNIWRFNLEGASSAAWSVVKFFQAPANQSITVRPRILRSAYEDVGTVRRKYVVTFGTGKYIEDSDRSTTFVQSYYGLYDQGPSSADYPLTQAKLRQQTLSQAGDIRQLTTNQVPQTLRGWFFNLIASGERNIAQAVVRADGSLIFTTLAPFTTNPCEPSARSFIMFVDGTTGGVPGTGAAGLDTNGDGVPDSTDATQFTPSFDTNLDGVVDSADNALATGIQLDGYAAGVTPITNIGGGGGQILLPDGAIGGDDANGNGIRDCMEAVPPNCPNQNLVINTSVWRRRSWRTL